MDRLCRPSQLLNELPTSGFKINSLRRTQEVFACPEIQRHVHVRHATASTANPMALAIIIK